MPGDHHLLPHTHATDTSVITIFYTPSLQAHSWLALPSHATIQGRGGSCLVAAGHRLYVLGGFCGHELADAFCFDLKAGKWDEVGGAEDL